MLAQEHGYLDRAQEMSLTRYFSTEPASLSSLSSEISTNSGLSWQPIYEVGILHIITMFKVIILVYQCNNGISKFDGFFVSMLGMGYGDGTKSVSNTLIQSLRRIRRQLLLFFAYRNIHTLEKREVSDSPIMLLFETLRYLMSIGKIIILLSCCWHFVNIC